MENSFFRFRSIKSLLDDFEELEKQSIYFAKPEQLNDPMEGFRDVFWSGDLIIWNNFFKHYLLCLERLCSLFVIGGEQHEITVDNIPVFAGEDDFPTPQYRDLFTKISESFFKITNIDKFIQQISSRSTPIRRDELSFYFRSIHSIALETIFEHYEKKGFITKGRKRYDGASHVLNELINNDFIGKIEEALKENNNFNIAADILFFAQRQSLEQIDIIQRFNGVIDSNTKNKNLVLIEFPEVYINQLEQLIYPDWFTACFMSEASNSSVWGHYSDNHKGVCLVFSPEKIGQKFFLKLRGVNGWSSTSGPTFGFSKHELLPINYKTGYGQIDFFKSLGRLSQKVLDSMWFSKDGKISICSEDMYKSEEDWRKRYWETFYRDITVKTKDWEYENEYRIILANSFDSYSKDEYRTLAYDFQSLSGIIFGIKTSKEDKIRILKIIDKKCEESKRTDFKFYQAYYSNTDNSIKYSELSLIKFKSEV